MGAGCAPAFPAPSRVEDVVLQKLGQPCRGNAQSYPPGCLKFETENTWSSRTSELLAARSAVKWRARSGTHNHRPLLYEDRPTPASYGEISRYGSRRSPERQHRSPVGRAPRDEVFTSGLLRGCLKFESESMSSRTGELLAARSADKWRARSGTHNHRPLWYEERPTPRATDRFRGMGPGLRWDDTGGWAPSPCERLPRGCLKFESVALYSSSA